VRTERGVQRGALKHGVELRVAAHAERRRPGAAPERERGVVAKHRAGIEARCAAVKRNGPDDVRREPWEAKHAR